MEALGRQLKKGALDILLLRLLANKPMYGYELLGVLDARSGGYFALKEGTLYPILYRLEDAGYIRSEWESDGGRRGAPRKYYAITPAGQTHLKSAQAELERYVDALLRIMKEDLA